MRCCDGGGRGGCCVQVFSPQSTHSLSPGQHSGTVVPTMGGMLPDHDYEEVPLEGEEDMRERSPSSHLTPPVESNYSIIMEEQQHLMERKREEEREGGYSHLGDDLSGSPRDMPENAYSEVTAEGGGGGGEREVNKLRNALGQFSTDDTEVAYSVVTDVVERPPARGLPNRAALPRGAPARPHTTYGHRSIPDKSVTGAPLPSSLPNHPLPLSAARETVSKAKFDLIMEQLRKVQVRVGREGRREGCL